ncbi:MAG TPA: ABC transporter substrate-binding protein, partial [Candidatus Binatia bacterium]|nr:ABC transporter substrate-binding protein [Candidatus Binatia bacterium]
LLKPEGIDLQVIERSDPLAMVREMIDGTYDVAEFSLGEYVFRLSHGRNDLTALPVFPLKMFRHGFIFCNSASGINSPTDLHGKKFALFRMSQTACVWVRGLLIEQYGISPARVIWLVPGPLAEEIQLRDGSKVKFIERTPGLDDKSLLDEALVTGNIDAMAAATFSSAFLKGDKRVVRLFRDYKDREVSYYKKTGIFPIMHVLVAKRSLVEKHPDLSQRLVALFSRAQEYARQRLHSEGSLSLAWKNHYLEEEEKSFGSDAWAYGLENNRVALDKFLSYSYDSGVSKRKMTPEELFDSNS